VAIFAVLEPPVRDADSVDHAERFAFVRDGFSWAAFFFGPLWMVRHVLIVEAIAWLVIVGAIVGVARVLPISSDAMWLLLVAFGCLVGLEAPTLRRWALRRRNWRELGIVVADDLEAAERRFFDAWVRSDAAVTVLTPGAQHRRGGGQAQPGADVIGLFPEPGVNR
jgi:hypothetical protein